MQITLEQLQRCTAGMRPAFDLEQIAVSVNETAARFELDSKSRLAHFLAQVIYETQNLTKFVENLYYTTPERLVTVWPSRFTMTPDSADGKRYAPDYVRNPAKLASAVYAGRYGNGDEASGDGGRFLGRGPMHLTFRDNYARCSQYLYNNDRLVQNPEEVSDNIETGMLTAGWFFAVEKKLNPHADRGDLDTITLRVNGSTRTVPERRAVLTKVVRALG